MVPKVTPRNNCERVFTHSKNSDMPLLWILLKVIPRISSQVAFKHSHISELTAPRWARPFSRAIFKQE